MTHHPQKPPHVTTPALVAFKHRKVMGLLVGVQALMVAILVAVHVDRSHLSFNQSDGLYKLAVLTLILTTVAEAGMLITLKARKARAQAAFDALPPEEVERWIQRAEADVTTKTRATKNVDGPDLIAIYRQRPWVVIILMTPLLLTALKGVLYVVAMVTLDSEQLRTVDHIIWGGHAGLPKLGYVGLMFSMPGALMLVMSLPQTARRVIQRDAEIHHALIRTAATGDSTGGLSIAKESEQGGLSIASAQGGLEQTNAHSRAD